MISEAVYLHYLNALLDGDKKQCYQIVSRLIDEKVNPRDIFTKLFQRSMYRVGQMWENDRCSISDEHIATKITEGLIDYVTVNYSSEENTGKSVVITCIDKEFHEIGARMVAGYLETHGFKVYFIGSNTPQNEVLKTIREKQPDLVGISNNFYLNFTRLVNLLKAIKEEFPSQKVLVGGQALAQGIADSLKNYSNAIYLPSLDALDDFIASTKQK